MRAGAVCAMGASVPERGIDYHCAVHDKPLRNVIFDFGGVLIRWRPQEIIEGFYADEALRARVREVVFEHPDWLEMDRGTLQERQAIERFAARMARPAGEMRQLMDHMRASLTPMEETLSIVRALARHGVALYALSNMPTGTYAHLRERHAFWDHFHGIVISAQERLVKPDPAIFDLIARRYQLDPAETLFIDDVAPNVESAARCGFRVIQFRDAAQCLRELDAHLPISHLIASASL
jgi:putative hydrolase of the HAD superfamily